MILLFNNNTVHLCNYTCISENTHYIKLLSCKYSHSIFLMTNLDLENIMSQTSFFNEQTKQSLVKTTIVEKYFDAWANIIVHAQNKSPHHSENRIAYIDLFAGPGMYKDGSYSTPLKILRKAIDNPKIRDRFVSLFNDKDKKHAQSLKDAIDKLPDIDRLKYKPNVINMEVGEEITEMLEHMDPVPTLLFVDPWGYKGLSHRLFNSVLKNWGSDGIFFFNYNRINMDVNNLLVKNHMDKIFGEKRINELTPKLEGLTPKIRELMIVKEFCQAIKSNGYRYTRIFTFKNPYGERTSHHLIYVSKSHVGYNIMKDIMGRECSSEEQGVPSFEYDPTSSTNQQTLLFELSRPLDVLKDMLLDQFAGRTIKMIDIYIKHNPGTNYIKKNYKKILRELEAEGLIEVSPHKKDSFGDNVEVTFTNRREV